MPAKIGYVSLMGVVFVLDAIHEASEDSNDASVKSEPDSVNSSPGAEAINLVSTGFVYIWIMLEAIFFSIQRSMELISSSTTI